MFTWSSFLLSLACFLGFVCAFFLLSLTVVAQGTLGITSDTPGTAAQREGPLHPEAIALVLISLPLILMAAKLGGDWFERMRQPAVLGELVCGVILGNLSLFGLHSLDYLKSDEIINVLAQLGVIFLLFEVGLGSNIKEMLEVGISSLLVALFGVIASMLLGWGVGVWFLSGAPAVVHVFLGATLSATSVGITARVLTDLGKIHTKEARIILGAAVIDDVMGLVILAAVAGMIKAADHGDSGVSLFHMTWIAVKAVLFLGVALWMGSRISPRMFRMASRLKVRGMLLATSVSFCFLLAYLAHRIELAPIVGAFAAGLILDPLHYSEFRERGEHGIEELLQPLTSFLVPVFFVLMGIRVDLRTFARLDILGLAAALTLAAIVGKQVCGLGVLERGLDRLSVGVGMIPRGEVGLIFASMGLAMTLKGTPVLSSAAYSAIVIMVIISTLVTPPILKLTLSRWERCTLARNGKRLQGSSVSR